METKESEQVVIPLSRTKILMITAGALVLTAGAVFLWFIADEQRRISPGFARIVSVLGTLLFGAGIIYGAVKLLDKRPGLVLDAGGIIDNSSAIAAGRIPWEEIVDIQTMSVSGQNFLSIIVTDPEKYIARGNPAKRMLAKANYKGYGTPIFISAMSLGMNLAELQDAVFGMYQKHGKSPGGEAV